MTVMDLEKPEVIAEAHWSVFLPTVVAALAFTGIWGVLEGLDRGHSSLARSSFLAGALAVPVIALFCFLRYQTTRIVRTFDGFWIERGWPSMTPRHVSFDEVADVAARADSLAGRFGAGILAVSLHSGEELRVRDLAKVGTVASVIDRSCLAQS